MAKIGSYTVKLECKIDPKLREPRIDISDEQMEQLQDSVRNRFDTLLLGGYRGSMFSERLKTEDVPIGFYGIPPEIACRIDNDEHLQNTIRYELEYNQYTRFRVHTTSISSIELEASYCGDRKEIVVMMPYQDSWCHPSRRSMVTGLGNRHSTIPIRRTDEPIPVEDESVFSPRPAYVPVEVSNEYN